MKKLVYSAFLVITLLSSFNSSANNSCTNCSISQMESKARSLGSGEHLIIDVEREVIKKYFVIIDELGDIPINYLEEMPVSTSELLTFNRAMEAKRNLEREVRNFRAPMVEEVVTAWDLSGNTRNQNIVANEIKESMPLVDYLTAYAQNTAELIGLVPNTSTVLTWEFPGGGYALYEIVGFADNGMVLRVINAIDGDGNSVPLTLSRFKGEFNFAASGPGFEGIGNATAAWGGKLTFNGVIRFGGNNGGVIATECVTKSDDRIECVAIQD